MKKRLQGRVESGFGVATDSLAPLYQAIRERSGLAVVEGTLNVRLGEPFIVIPDLILEGRDYDHHETILMQRCLVLGVPGLIARTNTQAAGCSHPLEIIEILAVERLRLTKKLRDGDPVMVEVERSL